MLKTVHMLKIDFCMAVERIVLFIVYLGSEIGFVNLPHSWTRKLFHDIISIFTFNPLVPSKAHNVLNSE